MLAVASFIMCVLILLVPSLEAAELLTDLWEVNLVYEDSCFYLVRGDRRRRVSKSNLNSQTLALLERLAGHAVAARGTEDGAEFQLSTGRTGGLFFRNSAVGLRVTPTSVMLIGPIAFQPDASMPLPPRAGSPDTLDSFIRLAGPLVESSLFRSFWKDNQAPGLFLTWGVLNTAGEVEANHVMVVPVSSSIVPRITTPLLAWGTLLLKDPNKWVLETPGREIYPVHVKAELSVETFLNQSLVIETIRSSDGGVQWDQLAHINLVDCQTQMGFGT